MEGDCTNNPEDWNNKSIELKWRETFKGRHSAQTKQIEVKKGAKSRNRYNQVAHLIQNTNGKESHSKTPQTRAKRSALSQQVTTRHT